MPPFEHQFEYSSTGKMNSSISILPLSESTSVKVNKKAKNPQNSKEFSTAYLIVQLTANER